MTESPRTEEAATSGADRYRFLPDAVRIEDTRAVEHEPSPGRPGGTGGPGGLSPGGGDADGDGD